MAESPHEQMAKYIGFDEADAANLRALAPYAAGLLPKITERFLQTALAEPETRQIVGDDPQQRGRARESFQTWLRELFGGRYDDAYWERRHPIGPAHAQIALPQRFMLAGIEIVWQEFARAIRAADVPAAAAKCRSLHKLLTLELALMLERYQSRHSEQIRQAERAAVRERLTRAEHFAQIGQLAASLAHEIKNPLAGISGAIQVMRDAMGRDDPHRPIIGEILRQIGRLDGTVKDLLVYARPKPPQFQTCDLSKVIDRVLTVVRSEPVLRRVRLDYQADGKLPVIHADEIQLEQLLMNLLLNATDASPEHGQVRLAARANGSEVELRVEDDGHGMDSEVRERAFEPFFTTKSKGTGLGLPICQKIVEAHGGNVELHSEIGAGTTVTVRLPRQPRGSSEDGGG